MSNENIKSPRTRSQVVRESMYDLVADENFIGASFFRLDPVYEYSTMYAAAGNDRPLPIFIVLITIINTAMLIAMLVVFGFDPNNPLYGPSPQALLDWGALSDPEVRAGEWWRIITSIFLHGGIVHYGMNTIFCLSIGWALERIYGHYRIAMIYLLSGIGGNLLSLVFFPNSITVGASGSLFSFLGVLLVDLFQNFGVLARKYVEAIKLFLIIFVSLLLGALFELINNFVHFGGFLNGIFLSLVLIPSVQPHGCFGRTGLIVLGTTLWVGYMVAVIILISTGDGADWCSFCHLINCVINCSA